MARAVLMVDGHQGGGRARTSAHDGFALNEGPHALYLHGALKRLLDELSIDVPGGIPTSTVYGRRGSTISLLPLSASSLARSSLLSMRSKAKGATVPRQAGQDRPRGAGRTNRRGVAVRPAR